MTLYRLSKIHSAVPSYLLVLLRHPPVPPVPASGSEREREAPLSALSTWRNGKEAVDVGPELAPMEGEILRVLSAESTLV